MKNSNDIDSFTEHIIACEIEVTYFSFYYQLKFSYLRLSEFLSNLLVCLYFSKTNWKPCVNLYGQIGD